MKSWQNPKGKNADVFLCCYFKNTVPSKKGGKTKHKGNNRSVARRQMLLKKQSCFVLRLSPLFRMRLWDAPLCRCPSAFIWDEVCVCVCVGGVPVCVSCQSACFALGWGKAPCGIEVGVECASWGEPPKPQSDELTAGILGSSYSLTSTPFFLDSPCYHIIYTSWSLSYSYFLISNAWDAHTVTSGWLPLFYHVEEEYIATPFAIASCLSRADVISQR